MCRVQTARWENRFVASPSAVLSSTDLPPPAFPRRVTTSGSALSEGLCSSPKGKSLDPVFCRVTPPILILHLPPLRPRISRLGTWTPPRFPTTPPLPPKASSHANATHDLPALAISCNPCYNLLLRSSTDFQLIRSLFCLSIWSQIYQELCRGWRNHEGPLLDPTKTSWHITNRNMSNLKWSCPISSRRVGS